MLHTSTVPVILICLTTAGRNGGFGMPSVSAFSHAIPISRLGPKDNAAFSPLQKPFTTYPIRSDNRVYAINRRHFASPRLNPIKFSSSTSALTSTRSNCINPLLARRNRCFFELQTLFRVILPAIIAGIVAFLSLPSLCIKVTNFVARTTDPGNVGILNEAVQSFISLVGLLYSILVGQVFGFLYSQQEALYLALFDEVTEAKSLLEQVALVSQGRSMYSTCLSSIARYVREDLLGGTMTLAPNKISTNQNDNECGNDNVKKVPATPSVTPSILISARPADDPLEAILYLTSVGIPGNIYDTVRSLRQARSRRLGALQRKVPVIHLLMLWILGIIMTMAFPVLIGVGSFASMGMKTLSSAGFRIGSLEGIMFGVATFAVVLTKMVLNELWRTKGGAYNVDAVLRVMVRGLECELDERMGDAKQVIKRSKQQ